MQASGSPEKFTNFVKKAILWALPRPALAREAGKGIRTTSSIRKILKERGFSDIAIKIGTTFGTTVSLKIPDVAAVFWNHLWNQTIIINGQINTPLQDMIYRRG